MTLPELPPKYFWRISRVPFVSDRWYLALRKRNFLGLSRELDYRLIYAEHAHSGGIGWVNHVVRGAEQIYTDVFTRYDSESDRLGDYPPKVL